jgi:hypothetical protein
VDFHRVRRCLQKFNPFAPNIKSEETTLALAEAERNIRIATEETLFKTRTLLDEKTCSRLLVFS